MNSRLHQLIDFCNLFFGFRFHYIWQTISCTCIPLLQRNRLEKKVL